MKVNVTTTNDLSGNIMSYKFTNDEYAYNYRARDKATAIKWVMDVTDYDCDYDKNGKRVRRNFRIASPETYVYVFCNNGESYLLNEMETYPIKYLNEANTIVIDTPDFSMIYGDSMKFVVDTDGEMIREYERDEYYDDCFNIPDEDGDYEIGEIEPEESIDKSSEITALFQAVDSKIDNTPARSAWDKGVKLYAHYLVADMIEFSKFDDTIYSAFINPVSYKAVEKILLNGASDWRRYSEGGCSLIYDGDIAERLCTPSELKKTNHGERQPNSRETWLEVQARALHQACKLIYTVIHEIYVARIAA